MSLLTGQDLLKKQVLKIEKVDLGDGDFVFVTEMSARSKNDWEQALLIKKRDSKGLLSFEQTLDDFRAKLAVVTLSNEKGELLLDSKDYSRLSQHMSAARLEKIVNAAQKLKAITEEDKEAIVKNSVVGPADTSPSDFVESSK